ncbi:tetratricopeptide repeat protein [Polycladidibacter hongkongensis]|uniref:tetratricopeptide repeat protein n=1 Tax=Polycladidibacter hongkongensis TaxID=1647556 RepID=UPI000835E7E5|nr:tetratricopeptide repeat protein [Pseudovibrio hongkongensis]
MSIIDIPPMTEKDLQAIVQEADPIVVGTLDELGLKDERFYQLMKKGISVSEMLDISEEELNAVFEMGRRAISVGNIDQAFSLFVMLVQIAPLEPKFTYGLGVCFQAQGNIAVAARMYLYFISLDATNPQGYLRLGECLLAAGECKEAAEAFEGALNMMTDPVKGYDDRAYAQSMIEASRRQISATKDI